MVILWVKLAAIILYDTHLSGTCGGGALGGLRLRKAFNHLFFILPAEDEDNFRSTPEALSAFAANRSLCVKKGNFNNLEHWFIISN